jgi:hypothetical protein
MNKNIHKDKHGNKLQVGDTVKRSGIFYKVVQIGTDENGKDFISIMPVQNIKYLNSAKSLELY